MTTCIVNKCDGSGLIPKGENYLECQCKPVENAFRIYQRSGAPIDSMIFTNDLKENPIVKNAKKQEMPMKDLIFTLLENGNLEKLVNESWFLYLSGYVGRGKTQLACTFSLEAAFWRNYKMKFIDERSLEHIVYNPDKKNNLLNEIEDKQILIIDDIGVTGKAINNIEMVQAVVNLLDYIIRKHKGLIIFTSNLRPEELEQAYGVTQSKQLVSVINKAKRRTYYFVGENVREIPPEEENDLF